MKRQFEDDTPIIVKIQKKTTITLTEESGRHVLRRGDDIGYSFPIFDFDKESLDKFREETEKTHTGEQNEPTRFLLNLVKGRWMVKDILEKFITLWDDDCSKHYPTSCLWWRQLFRKSLNQWTEKKLDTLDNEGGAPLATGGNHGIMSDVPTMDSPDDLGQLIVLIGMYCYGFHGSAAWEHLTDATKDIIKAQELFVTIKYIIDFFHTSLSKDSVWMIHVSGGDNARFHYGSTCTVNRLFPYEHVDYNRYDTNARKYA
jgi:hypothetical protein